MSRTAGRGARGAHTYEILAEAVANEHRAIGGEIRGELRDPRADGGINRSEGDAGCLCVRRENRDERMCTFVDGEALFEVRDDLHGRVTLGRPSLGPFNGRAGESQSERRVEGPMKYGESRCVEKVKARVVRGARPERWDRGELSARRESVAHEVEVSARARRAHRSGGGWGGSSAATDRGRRAVRRGAARAVRAVC